MTDANCDPSSNNAIRRLTDVLALKKASQLVVMAATAAAPPGEVAGDDDVGAGDVGGGADVVLGALGLLPPHAVASTASPASATAPTRCDKCR